MEGLLKLVQNWEVISGSKVSAAEGDKRDVSAGWAVNTDSEVKLKKKRKKKNTSKEFREQIPNIDK